MGVADDFKTFQINYNIGMELISRISDVCQLITRRLNTDFWNTDSNTSHSFYVGSYGRDTAAKGISDIDVAFRLPDNIYYKYDAYQTNGQSALLQSIKRSIDQTYPSSRIGGDGQVVSIAFTNGITFEILPVFENISGSWTYPNTNNGGSWEICNPKVEIEAIRVQNGLSNNNLKALCKMIRIWRDYHNIPMKGALIDTLAYQFIKDWEHQDKSYLYHDFMIRDFLDYLKNRDTNQNYWRMPGSNSYVYRTGPFEYHAGIHHKHAVSACNYQEDTNAASRRSFWRKVFGPTFPT